MLANSTANTWLSYQTDRRGNRDVPSRNLQAVGQCLCFMQTTSILLESTPITGCRHREVELAHRTPSGLANVESANCNWHACMHACLAELPWTSCRSSWTCPHASTMHYAECCACAVVVDNQALYMYTPSVDIQGCCQQYSRHFTEMSIASSHSGCPMLIWTLSAYSHSQK